MRHLDSRLSRKPRGDCLLPSREPVHEHHEISPRLGTPLQAACQGGQLEPAKILLKWGADPGIHGGRFKTCLVAAAYSGNSDVVRLLVDWSVSINEYNEVAGSDLHASVRKRLARNGRAF